MAVGEKKKRATKKPVEKTEVPPLRLEWLDPAELAANPRNWRTHPQRQVDSLRDVISQVGWAGAALFNERTGRLIDGHCRQKLGIEQGCKKIPVLVGNWSEAQEMLILATFDPLGAEAETDVAKLEEVLREVSDGGSEALAAMLDELAQQHGIVPGGGSGEVSEDDVPEPPKDAVSRTGDLWICGDHRLLCGDSTKAEHVARLMGGEKAHLCFTSPPYAQQRDYTEASKAHTADWDKLMRGVFGNLPMADDGQVLVNLGLVHRDGEWWPYWDGWIEWMRGQGWRRFGWYVWDQGFGLPGDWNGRFAPSHEFVFHFNHDPSRPAKFVDKKPENIKPRNRGESTMRDRDGNTKVFTNPGASAQPTKIPDSIIRVNRQVGSNGHPAQFPVGLPAFIMEAWPGDVYEPFGGSGTTIIAAEQLHRRCFSIEIEPRYVDVAIERYQRLTNRPAILEATGQTFEETGRERCVA